LSIGFTLAGSMKGALFMDAVIIWLFNEDPTRPDGGFHLNTFLDQVGISYGWGLRWDFDFIVARLDFAYTLRTPYLPVEDRWTDGFQFWDPVINIAIGYPFLIFKPRPSPKDRDEIKHHTPDPLQRGRRTCANEKN
jgi:hypothetical protein